MGALVLLGGLAWMLAAVFVIALCRMAANQDRAAGRAERRLYFLGDEAHR